jgi:hypothetical protein
MTEPGKGGELEFDELLAAYRDACIVPEAKADFMPRLWERIENRRKWTDPLWHWANSLAAMAAAASLFIVLMQVLPSKTSLTASRSYVELLAEEHESEDLDLQLVSWAPAPRTPDGDGK